MGGTTTAPTVTDLTITDEASGDILYFNGTNWIRLAKSTDGKILKLASGIPAWDTEITVQDASITVKGITEEATEAEIDADTATGGTSARLFVNPSTLVTSKYGVRLPTANEKLSLAGTGTPGSGNEYVTDDDTSNSTTANKVIRYTAGGDVNVPATPSANQDASSKVYVDDQDKYALTVVASENLKVSADAEQTTTQTSFTKVKEIRIKQDGIIRVKFDIRTTESNEDSRGRIYVDGVAVGTDRTNSTTSYVTYPEDITVKIGDLVQLYYFIDSVSATAYTRNFRIYFDASLSDGVVKQN